MCVWGRDREGDDRDRVREIVSGEARVRKREFSVEQMLEECQSLVSWGPSLP